MHGKKGSTRRGMPSSPTPPPPTPHPHLRLTRPPRSRPHLASSLGARGCSDTLVRNSGLLARRTSALSSLNSSDLEARRFTVPLRREVGGEGETAGGKNGDR